MTTVTVNKRCPNGHYLYWPNFKKVNGVTVCRACHKMGKL